ncbi:hypothetical protein ALC56_12874 [Trachymyrmex septentrionalis]|uniref:Uncharacterized protein n=1 Tax=Trachymyrmex septentrionalis TaxID=34720 RepID=A0A195EY49_9HYME|nr:hypothetical protein ALC56_12874 [Trachymyrmex septentrionalis]
MKGDNGQEGPREKTEGQWGGEESRGSKGGNGIKYCSVTTIFVYNRHLTKPRSNDQSSFLFLSLPSSPPPPPKEGPSFEQTVKSAAKPSKQLFPINGRPTKIGNKLSGKAILVHRSTPPSSTGRQPPEAPLPLTAGRIPPPPGSGAYGKYSSSLRMSSCSRIEE